VSFNMCGAGGYWVRAASANSASFNSTIKFYTTSTIRKELKEKGRNFLEPEVLLPSNSNKESQRRSGSPVPRPRRFFHVLPFAPSLSSLFFHNSPSVNVQSYHLFQQRQLFLSSTFQLFTSTCDTSFSKNMAPHPDNVDETKKVVEVEVTPASTPMETEVSVAVRAGSEPRDKLLFAKLSENASAPTKGSKLAAGYDIMSAYDAVVPKRGSSLVKTDIQVQLPVGTYGRIAPRSGLALKKQDRRRCWSHRWRLSG